MANKVDLEIFKVEESENNICSSNGDEDIECLLGIKCLSIKRIIAALKYYQLFDIINNENDRDIFNDFINDIYGDDVINDYIRIINNHKYGLQEINEWIINNKLLNLCDIKKCQFGLRHFDDDNNEDNKLDPILTFFKETFDSLHFYLLHLFECGMRTKKEIKENKENDDQYADDDEFVDKMFLRIHQNINQRKHLTKIFNRFKNNKKFNININKQQDNKNNITFMDRLYQYLYSNIYHKEKVNKFKKYIINQEYDSDALLNDIDFDDDDDDNKHIGNIYKYLNDEKQIKNAIKHFIKTIKSMY